MDDNAKIFRNNSHKKKYEKLILQKVGRKEIEGKSQHIMYVWHEYYENFLSILFYADSYCKSLHGLYFI